VVVGPLGPGWPDRICGTAFSIPPPPTPTPTVTATQTPVATATPLPRAGCVCSIVLRRVPPVILNDALANPEHFHGWMEPLNANKPPGPDNPPRTCLTLQNHSLDFHPLWNRPLWHVGCP
jgi:hypothetical protein